MKQQKDEILEMTKKRAASAYRTQEEPGNAKTRKIEYYTSLSKDPVELMKERQKKEMENMMSFELQLQVGLYYRTGNQETERRFLEE